MKLVKYYKCGDTIAIDTSSVSYSQDKVRVNSRALTPLHKQGWSLAVTNGSEVLIEILQPPKPIDWYYGLRDKSAKGFPETLSLDDVGERYDEDEEYDRYSWSNEEHIPYKGLYERVCHYSKEEWIKVDDIELRCLGSVDIKDITAPIKSFTVDKDSSCGVGEVELSLGNSVTYEELTEALIDPLLRHNYPCKLEGRATFKIIRKYVKDNIQGTCASVTSDYDFCFTVKRRVEVTPYKKERLKKDRGSYSPPRFSKTITAEHVVLFEMTSGVDKYGKYPVVADFSGETLQDLIDNIDEYLKELLDSINTPLKRCSCCSGSGLEVVE